MNYIGRRVRCIATDFGAIEGMEGVITHINGESVSIAVGIAVDGKDLGKLYIPPREPNATWEFMHIGERGVL